MLFFLIDFGDITTGGVIATGASSSAISEADCKQIEQIAPQRILKDGPPLDVQIIANGQLEAPIATTELQVEVGGLTFVERLIVMANLAKPLIELLFLQRYGSVLDMREGILNFASFSTQLKDANNSYPGFIETLLNPPHDNLLQIGKQALTWVKSQRYKVHEVTGILQPSQQIENNDELIICPAILSSKNHHLMVQINNFQDHPNTLKKTTYIKNF